jgi:hypothetical protein
MVYWLADFASNSNKFLDRRQRIVAAMSLRAGNSSARGSSFGRKRAVHSLQTNSHVVLARTFNVLDNAALQNIQRLRTGDILGSAVMTF